METIKNYLETMFRGMPDTPEIQRAERELRQRMEERYTQLVREGKNENEAVGIVISEVGGLDEQAQKLGMHSVVSTQTEVVRYNNKTLAAVMSVYWPIVLGIYLAWSFLSHDWHITWMIWPIAVVAEVFIKNLCGK